MIKQITIKEKARVTSKVILRHLLIVGTLTIAASSPYFVHALVKEIFKDDSKNKRRHINSFYYLKRRGLIKIERDGNDVHVSLTKKGEWATGKFQFNELKIPQPKKWDGKWRIVIFDIPHEHRMKRDMFRTKLKELGFYSLQKSVWVYPYECKKEIRLVREFFELEESDIRLIVGDIERDSHLREAYDFR